MQIREQGGRSQRRAVGGLLGPRNSWEGEMVEILVLLWVLSGLCLFPPAYPLLRLRPSPLHPGPPPPPSLLSSTPLPCLGMQILRTAQAALGKGCLASSFICVYLFTGELYPTEIRQMGMGFASVYARLGGLAAPLVTTLGEYSTILPPVSFGATAVLAGLAGCFLTETHNAPLVETIAAMERRAKEASSKKHVEEKSEEISLQQLRTSPLRETI